MSVMSTLCLYRPYYSQTSRVLCARIDGKDMSALPCACTDEPINQVWAGAMAPHGRPLAIYGVNAAPVDCAEVRNDGSLPNPNGYVGYGMVFFAWRPSLQSVDHGCGVR